VTLTRDDVTALRDAALDADARVNDLTNWAEMAEALSIRFVRAGDVAAAAEMEREAHEARRQAVGTAEIRDLAGSMAREAEGLLDELIGFGPEDDPIRFALFWPTEDRGNDSR